MFLLKNRRIFENSLIIRWIFERICKLNAFNRFCKGSLWSFFFTFFLQKTSTYFSVFDAYLANNFDKILRHPKNGFIILFGFLSSFLLITS